MKAGGSQRKTVATRTARLNTAPLHGAVMQKALPSERLDEMPEDLRGDINTEKMSTREALTVIRWLTGRNLDDDPVAKEARRQAIEVLKEVK